MQLSEYLKHCDIKTPSHVYKVTINVEKGAPLTEDRT